MPGMNGFEFVSNFKKIRPDIKVFLMSAFQIRDIEYSKFLPPTTDRWIHSKTNLNGKAGYDN
jgi:hypothetical protein